MRKERTLPKGFTKQLWFIIKQMSDCPWLLAVTALTLILSTGGNLIAPYLTKPIINDYILMGDVPGLVRMLALLALVYGVAMASSYINARVLVRLSQRVTRRLRTKIFDKMQSLPMSYFDTHTHGELMSLYTNDVDTVSGFVSSSLSSLAVGIPTFVGIMIILLTMNPLLTLVSALFLVAQYFTMKKSGGLSRKYFVSQQQDLAGLNGYIEEMTQGQKVIKAFSFEDRACERFDEGNKRLFESSYRAQLYAGIINPALGGIAEINNAATSCVGVVMVIFRMFDVGSLISFIAYVQNAGMQIGVLAGMVNMVLSAVAGASRIMNLLDQEPEPDEGDVELVDGHWKARDVDVPLRGDIELKDVCFGYTPGQRVLERVSLSACPDRKIALVGSTGAGKTTITNLITRFYEPTSGEITFDGIPLTRLKKEALRGTLSLVLQDSHLFTGTVRENIRFSRPEATDAQVEAAAALAGATFFISHLPKGFDTVITGDGGSLSQGQRQLLAIARAACAEPRVIILDEATSSIDTMTEKQVELGLDRLMEGRTVFVVAHRLSTVRRCDEILVMEMGQIIERGSHDALLAKKGRYYDLYTGQAELD